MGVAYARSLPPEYLGASVINLTVSAGTGRGAEQVARFQALIRDPGFIAPALTEAGLANPAPDVVASRITSKVIGPGTLLQVEARWSDAATAGRLPSVLARRAVAVLQGQQQKADAEDLAARQKNWVDAEQQVQRASAAFVEAWLSRRVELSRVDPAVGRELDETLEELRQLRARVQTDARIIALETQAPPAEATATAYSKLSVRAQQRMADLETRRDLLVLRMSIDRPHEEIIEKWSELDARQKQLEIDLATAREASTEAQKALTTAKAAAANGVGMELIEPSVSPGRPVGLALTAFLARGLASGLMFAVFSVFLFYGVSINVFGRRT